MLRYKYFRFFFHVLQMLYIQANKFFTFILALNIICYMLLSLIIMFMQKMTEINAANRKRQKNMHTAGKISFARIRKELVREHCCVL